MNIVYSGRIAKSTVFFQKYVTYITINYQLFIQDNKNLIIKIDKKVFI